MKINIQMCDMQEARRAVKSDGAGHEEEAVHSEIWGGGGEQGT
jgi:hypothetical protein